MTDTVDPTFHYRTCPLCEATCGLELRVENGNVTRIRGDRDDVFSKGFICPKGSVLHHLQDDPDRLTTPQIRNVDGSHRDATWDEAFAEIERLLMPSRKAGGANSTAIYIGNPTVHGPTLYSLGALASAATTPNIFSAASVDQLARQIACGLLYGDPEAWPVPDIDRTDLLVLVGANPVVSGGSLATAPDWPGRLAALRERGGRVVVIDPRRTETAAKADEWLGIVPGTDALLLAAIANAIFESADIDLGPAGALIDNVDATAAALARFTPEAVESRVGIDAQTIRKLAADIAAADRAVVYGRVGLQTNAFGTMSSWLTDVVNIAAGHLDKPGGQMFADPAAPLFGDAGYPDGYTIGRWHTRVHGHPECNGQFPAADLADEILTPGAGQIRSLICLAGNPVRSLPDSGRLDEAMTDLDCLVSIDFYRNETSRHAHVILPPPGPLERPHYDLYFYPMGVRNVANFSPALFTPEGPTEEDIQLRLAGLLMGLGPDADTSMIGDGVLAAVASGVGHDGDLAELDGDTLFERALDLVLRNGPYDDMSLRRLRENPHGIDLGPLEPALPGRLRTPNGRIDLLPPLIEGDLPRLAALLDAPTPEFMLIGRRQLRSNNTWMHNIRILMKGKPRCTLMVNTDDAAVLGVDDGDEVRVSNSTGTVIAPVEVTDDIVRGVVSLPHGWGHDVDGQAIANANPGVNSNVLTDASQIDPLSGVCSINAIPVTLSPS